MSPSVNCPHCDEEVPLRPGRAADCPTCGAQLPIPTARRSADRDDEPRPRRKYRREWDDDEPDRQPRRGGGRSLGWVLIGLLAGGIVLVGVVAVVITLSFTDLAGRPASATATGGQLRAKPLPPLPPQQNMDEPWEPNRWVAVPGREAPPQRGMAPPQPDANSYPAEPPFEIDPKLPTPGVSVYLDELTPFAVKQGPWKLGRGGAMGDPNNHRVVVNKRFAEHGIGMHPPSSGVATASFALGGRLKTLKGYVALNDSWEGNPDAGAEFAVLLDGREVWRSASVKERGRALPFKINVTGVQVLTIETHCSGDNYRCHCVWLDPVLE